MLGIQSKVVSFDKLLSEVKANSSSIPQNATLVAVKQQVSPGNPSLIFETKSTWWVGRKIQAFQRWLHLPKDYQALAKALHYKIDLGVPLLNGQKDYPLLQGASQRNIKWLTYGDIQQFIKAHHAPTAQDFIETAPSRHASLDHAIADSRPAESSTFSTFRDSTDPFQTLTHNNVNWLKASAAASTAQPTTASQEGIRTEQPRFATIKQRVWSTPRRALLVSTPQINEKAMQASIYQSTPSNALKNIDQAMLDSNTMADSRPAERSTFGKSSPSFQTLTHDNVNPPKTSMPEDSATASTAQPTTASQEGIRTEQPRFATVKNVVGAPHGARIRSRG